MMKNILPILSTLVSILVLANCVREIDFQQDDIDSSTLVVNGVFTTHPGLQKLHLSRPINYKNRNFPHVSGANVRLMDDQGNTFQYLESSSATDSYYVLNAQGQVGRTYTLEIDLPDGEQYRSHPQKMPDLLPLDTLEVHGEWAYSNTAEGVVVREPFAFVYARDKAPANPAGHYLRWDSDATYIFNERSGAHQCFINNRLNDQLVAIADLSRYEPGGVVYQNVGKRKIDQAFEWEIGINAYQYSIGREAYEYWEKVNKLLSANGTIFDAPPATVNGNLDNLSHPDRPALGFFEVSAVDSFRVYTVNGRLGEEFLLQNYPYCAIRYINGFSIEIPKECNDCLYIAGATYNVPWWWH